MLPFTLLVFCMVELPKRAFIAALNTCYMFLQSLIVLVFKPPKPKTGKHIKYRGRIAVVGGGLTGVSSAAHAAAHGFDVVIYEKSDRVGGIWASVNKTSGLQLNSLLYRFHPSIVWKRGFPQRDEILSEIRRIHNEYSLGPRTRFNTPVTSIKRAEGSGKPSTSDEGASQSRWIINNGEDGEFDAVIVTVGTCGSPNMVTMQGMPGWKDQKKEEEHDSAEAEKTDEGDKHDEEKEDSEDEKARDSDEDTVWTQPKEDPDAIEHDQEEKKAQGFPDPHEAYVAEDKPTQDDSNTNSAGVWDRSKPKENAWDVGRDQMAKKDQGFPQPGEVYGGAEDTQKPVEEVVSEGIHEKVSGNVLQTRSRKTSRKEHKRQREHEGQQDNHDDNDEDVFKGPIIHSSALDHDDAPSFEDKTIVVIGSGASAVEAVETALAKGAKKCVVLARQDKWIIPRNIIFDTLVSAQPFGRETPLSFMWEKIITWYHYRGVEDLVPANTGLFEGTPVVNDEFLKHVRAGKCDYVRGDTERLTSRGVRVNVRSRNSKPGDEGESKEFDADIVVMATGFHKPDISFLPDDLFPEGYERPNLYLQNFATEDWSILMTNSSYMNAIGHIGIYARILLTFLMDKNARPTPKDMKLWVDVIRFIKRGAKGGALGFFTYMELTIWLVLFHLFRIDRLRWLLFIMQGWGVHPQYA
ncbi:FAD/NAD(P)-binding domain-containing protein [Trametopsis cervina]|nr:FAD/NAD(P)-binding domain-containing protein [Trametopsis cervina]